jgi:LysM repeat protein
MKTIRLLLIAALLLLVPVVGAQQRDTCGTQYIVQRGDTLTTIAATCDTTVEEIGRASCRERV